MLASAPSAGVELRASGELVAGCGVYNHGGLGLLFVSSAYRRRGLGRLVAAAVTEAVLASGGAEVFADVRADNEASLALFQSLGYCFTR